MKNLNLLIIIFFITIFTKALAQQSKIYTYDNLDFDKALELYNAKQFLTAQILFQQIKNSTSKSQIKEDCAYYIANSAIRLNQRSAEELIQNFVNDYPTSSKINTAFNDVGDYYFRNSKYAYALKWYNKVDIDNLSNKQIENFLFKKGYSLFHTNQKEKSKKYFTKVEDSPLYGNQAKYYLGFLAYQGDDYKEASSYFDQVKDQKKYQEKMTYFQADMNFKLGNFNKAIDLASQRLSLAIDDEERSQLNKIIGESFFNLGNYDKALIYLKEYKGKNKKWTNTDHYQLGYVYFKRNEFQAAISEFNKIIDGQNAIAQNAYYHLAQCYLNTDKKSEALNAFKNASEMDFSKEIKENSNLNYAKLSYELGNPYEAVPEVLLSFLKDYPNSNDKQEIENLLLDSYITSKNYEKAIRLLENKSGLNYKIAYQKVAFYRGVELFNEGNYVESKKLFQKSLKYPKTDSFTSRAQFWKAECEYRLDNFENAVVGYKLFALNDSITKYKETKNLDYQIGYAYFKQKLYKQAIPYFLNFISKTNDDEQKLIDAYLRLGDSYFATKDYWKAMETYNEVKKKNGSDQDYAHFQKAISYGFVGKNKAKIEDLKLFLKDYINSQYTDDALYELGNTYVLINNVPKAVSTFDELLAKFPNSNYASKALIKQGLVYYNNDLNDLALNKFKNVVEAYPGTPEAKQSVATSRLIYIDLDRVEEYVAWVKNLDFVNVTDSELDNTTYEAAEKQFLDNNTKKAIDGFNTYLKNFANGNHVIKTNFYLGQLYFKNNNNDKAINSYKLVIEKIPNEFSEQAFIELCQIYLESKRWNESIEFLERLEKTSNLNQNIIFAQSNLMKANYELQNFEKSVLYAEKVLLNSKIDESVKSDAQLIIARSALKSGDLKKSRESYRIVQDNTKEGALAAEALYYNAYFLNIDMDYEKSNLLLQELTKEYSGYKYFAAKGLVLRAKNLYELGDSYQANYILEAVVENFKEFEDVFQEAKEELLRIKTEESKRNSSILLDPIEEIEDSKSGN